MKDIQETESVPQTNNCTHELNIYKQEKHLYECLDCKSTKANNENEWRAAK